MCPTKLLNKVILIKRAFKPTDRGKTFQNLSWYVANKIVIYETFELGSF
jgi:hypothetical protein